MRNTCLLANKGYDTGAIIAQAKGQGMEPCNPVTLCYPATQNRKKPLIKSGASRWWWKLSGYKV